MKTFKMFLCLHNNERTLHYMYVSINLKMIRIFISFFTVLLKSAIKLISCFLHDQLNSHAHTSILTNQLGMLRNHYITICGLAFM